MLLVIIGLVSIGLGHLAFPTDGYTEETDGGVVSAKSDGHQQVVGDGANPTEELFVPVKE